MSDNKLIQVITNVKADSRWIALDKDNRIISEGKTPMEVNALAKDICDHFFLTFVPVQGMSYVF